MKNQIQIKQIIVANVTEVERLHDSGYACISAVGKLYGKYSYLNEKITILKGLATTYGMFYQLMKGQDHMAVTMTYRDMMNKVDLVTAINSLNVDQIALIGYGFKGQFCHRYILAEKLREYTDAPIQNFSLPSYGDSLKLQKSLWNADIYKLRGHSGMHPDWIGGKLEEAEFIFAKTMKHNPHHYTLRKNWADEKEFLFVVQHIRFYGDLIEFGGIIYRSWFWKGFRYWTMPEDFLNEDCDLINRAKADD